MASRKNRSRKSLAVALAVVGAAGLSMASAAQLTVSSDEIVAGVDTFSGCDADGVTVSYNTSYSSGAFNLSSVDVKGIDAACDSLALTVEILGTGPGYASLEELTGTAATGTVNLPVSGTINAANVYGVAVEIG